MKENLNRPRAVPQLIRPILFLNCTVLYLVFQSWKFKLYSISVWLGWPIILGLQSDSPGWQNQITPNVVPPSPLKKTCLLPWCLVCSNFDTVCMEAYVHILLTLLSWFWIAWLSFFFLPFSSRAEIVPVLLILWGSQTSAVCLVRCVSFLPSIVSSCGKLLRPLRLPHYFLGHGNCDVYH